MDKLTVFFYLHSKQYLLFILCKRLLKILSKKD